MLFLGTKKNGMTDEDRSLAKVNQVAGLGTAFLGLYGLLAAKDRDAAAQHFHSGGPGQVRIGPALVPVGSMARLGVVVHARF